MSEDEEMDDEVSTDESDDEWVPGEDISAQSDADSDTEKRKDPRFHCHLTKLKAFRLHEVTGVADAYNQVKGHIEATIPLDTDIHDENEKKRNRRTTLSLKGEEEYTENENYFFFREYEVYKKGRYRGKDEPKYGTITFVYWIQSEPMRGEEIPIYAVLNNRLCQAWSMLKSRRKLDFPMKMAKQLLDPTTIRSADINYLSTGNIGSDRYKYNNNKFDPIGVMSKYVVY